MTYDGATATATLDPTADLVGNTLYTVTLASSIADTSGNSLGSDVTWTFRTIAAPATFTDTTTANFGAGSIGANTYVSETSDGEVILNPTVGAEFSGTTLPTGWSSTLWSNDAAGGVDGLRWLRWSMDGGRAGTTTSTFGQGRSLEFVATFRASRSSTSAIVVDFEFNSPVGHLQHRPRPAAPSTPARATQATRLIPGSWLNAPHRYRIDWTSTGFVYFIDGNQVASRPFATTTPMRPLISDATAGRWLPSPSTGCG